MLRQLAVCHGIVLDRTQEIKGAGPIYTERCCRHSYGVLVRELYNPIRHMGEDVVLDPRDKQKWAERQVHWFIKQVRLCLGSEGAHFADRFSRARRYLSEMVFGIISV